MAIRLDRMTVGAGALTLVVHGAVWLGGLADPSLQEPLVDARTYHELAVGLARDGILTEQFFWQAPFYPFFLALVYKLCGVSFTAVRIVQIGLAAGTAMLTARLGRRVGGRPAGWLAGGVLALSGPLVFFDLQLLSTGWAAFWMVVLAHLALDAFQEEGSWQRAFWLGIVGALAVLPRPTFWPVLGVFGLWGLLRKGLRWRVAALLSGLLVVLIPYGLTMKSLTGRAGIVPPSGGINFYIGNNPHFAETINIRVGREWEALVAEPRLRGHGDDTWAAQRYFRGRVENFLRDDPAAFMRLLFRKTGHLLSSRELPRNVDIYLHREYSPLLAALVFKVGPWGFPMGLILPLAVVGWWWGRPRGTGILPLMLLAYGAALVLVFMASRYRAAMLPLLAVGAAQGLIWLRARWFGGEAGTRARSGAALLAIGLLVTVPGPFAQEGPDLRGELFYGVGWNHYQREEWATAEEYFRQAVQAAPDMEEAHHFLALTLVRREAWQEACASFARCVELAPDYQEAVNNLDRCRGRKAEADYRRARALEGRDPAAALKLYEEIFQSRPGWLEGRVRLAWMLATIEDESLRDRARARRLLDDPGVRKLGETPYLQEVWEAARKGDRGG